MEKFCKDCRYAKRDWRGWGVYARWRYADCHNPKLGIEPMDGLVKAIPCSSARRDYLGTNYYCGPEGEWFEPRPPSDYEDFHIPSFLVGLTVACVVVVLCGVVL